jgi:hypothetical protein
MRLYRTSHREGRGNLALPQNLWANFVIPGMQRLGFPRHGEDKKSDMLPK